MNTEELLWQVLQEFRELKADVRRIADHFDPPSRKGIERKLDKVIAQLAKQTTEGQPPPPPETKGKPKWLTPAEVAKVVGKSAYTIREGCRTGGIKAKKWTGTGKGQWANFTAYRQR